MPFIHSSEMFSQFSGSISLNDSDSIIMVNCGGPSPTIYSFILRSTKQYKKNPVCDRDGERIMVAMFDSGSHGYMSHLVVPNITVPLTITCGTAKRLSSPSSTFVIVGKGIGKVISACGPSTGSGRSRRSHGFHMVSGVGVQGGIVSSRYSAGDSVCSCGAEAWHDGMNSTSAMVRYMILESLRVLITFLLLSLSHRD